MCAAVDMNCCDCSSHSVGTHGFNMNGDRHQTLEKLILEGKVKGQRNRRKPKRSWEKDVEDRMVASVWQVGRRAEYRLMYGRSVKAAMSGKG